jgi:SRSO17 transposase
MFTIEPIETAPVLALAPQDMDTLLDELQTSHALYRPLFQRREQREWSEKYLHGLLLELPRKSLEPMVLALEGANRNTVRAMQPFLSEGAWDDAPILQRHWQEVEHDLGDDNGVLTLDGSDFPTQGTASVGVKRQSCGELGKRANGQAGVFLG